MAVLEIYLEILTNFFEILHPPLALNKDVELTLSYQRRIDVSVSNWICLS